MLVGAGDDVDRAADQRLQRLRAAAEVVDGDVEPLLLEVAEPLADGQRQVVERGLAADGEGDLLLLDAGWAWAWPGAAAVSESASVANTVVTVVFMCSLPAPARRDAVFLL